MSHSREPLWYEIFDDVGTRCEVTTHEEDQQTIFRSLARDDPTRLAIEEEIDQYEVHSDSIEYASDDELDEHDTAFEKLRRSST